MCSTCDDSTSRDRQPCANGGIATPCNTNPALADQPTPAPHEDDFPLFSDQNPAITLRHKGIPPDGYYILWNRHHTQWIVGYVRGTRVEVCGTERSVECHELYKRGWTFEDFRPPLAFRFGTYIRDLNTSSYIGFFNDPPTPYNATQNRHHASEA